MLCSGISTREVRVYTFVEERKCSHVEAGLSSVNTSAITLILNRSTLITFISPVRRHASTFGSEPFKSLHNILLMVVHLSLQLLKQKLLPQNRRRSIR